MKHVRHLKNSSSNGTRSIKDFQGGPMFGMNAMMMDAPLVGTTGVAHFNVGVLGIDAIDQNGDSWQLTGSDTPQVYDLLALRTTSVNLGSGSLPAGTYPSVQLLLDPATTTLTLNGQTYPVYFVTSAHPWWDPTQTLESVNIPLAVTGNNGDQLTATLDFNVFQSADVRDGAVYLTPTVAAGFGQPAIDGTVVNAAGQPVQNATVIATDANGNVANVTATGADGTFELHGINPGGYTVSVANSFTTNAGDVVNAVGADAGGAPSQYVVVGPNSKVQLGSLQD
ncbi:MAG TPA: carboxypeptidase regulatory-like domain-containing protein [Candidatus Elarobacter sp.]